MIKLKRSGQTKQISGINITPFTDVCLVLLIIFMVTANAMVRSETGFNIQLPKADSNSALPTGPAIVTIQRGPHIFVGSKEVTFNTLMQEISRYQPGPDGKRLMIVKADELVPYYLIIKAIDIAGQAGVSNTLLATDPKTKKATVPSSQPSQ